MKRESWIALDGLRGVSILSVVMVHLWAHASPAGDGLPITISLAGFQLDLTWIFATGHNAVVTFFVLSGFLLYRHWLETADAGTAWRRSTTFYRKRLLRILPAFVFFTLIYLLLVWVLGKHRFGAPLDPANLFLNLTFLAPLAAGTAHVSSLDIVPGTWSLNAEMWFYVLMPLLAYALRASRYRLLALAALALLPLGYRAMLGEAPDFVSRFSLPGVADAFLAGMAVAVLSVQGRIRRGAGWWFPVGALWYVLVCAGSDIPGLDSYLQLALASALMIVGLIAPGDWPWKRGLSGRLLTGIGHISFSMFLCNVLVVWYVVLPLAELFGVHSVQGRFVMNLVIGYPIIHAISVVGYRYVEQPFLRRPLPSPGALLPGAVAICGGIFVVALLASALAYTARDGAVEYGGTLVRWTSGMAPGSLQGKGLDRVPIEGAIGLDSDSGAAAVHATLDADGRLQVSSPGVVTGDGWIAVMLPVDMAGLGPGHRVHLRATLSSQQARPVEVCLGVYNGREDTCSARVALGDTHELRVSTVLEKGVLQFKLNVFPGGATEPFDLQLSGLRVYRDRF